MASLLELLVEGLNQTGDLVGRGFDATRDAGGRMIAGYLDPSGALRAQIDARKTLAEIESRREPSSAEVGSTTVSRASPRLNEDVRDLFDFRPSRDELISREAESSNPQFTYRGDSYEEDFNDSAPAYSKSARGSAELRDRNLGLRSQSPFGSLFAKDPIGFLKSIAELKKSGALTSPEDADRNARQKIALQSIIGLVNSTRKMGGGPAAQKAQAILDYVLHQGDPEKTLVAHTLSGQALDKNITPERLMEALTKLSAAG